MTTFGIIGEGVTDRVVVKSILVGYFGEDAFVTGIQPPERAAGADPPPGGWDLVFKSLAQGDHVEALARNDYVVIQIDTDVCEQKGYDVPRREGGRTLSADELILRVIEKLKGMVGRDCYSKHAARFIFAIAVDSVECWLLPLLYSDGRAAKITGCLAAGNEALRRSDEAPLSRNGRRGVEKDLRAYQRLSRQYTRRKRLLELRDKNPSLDHFVGQLDALGAGLSSPPPESEREQGPCE